MSRDFELLRKIGSGRRGLADGAIREIPSGGSGRSTESPAHYWTGDDSPAQEPSWSKALGILRKRWRFASAVAALIVIATASIIFMLKPEYEPTARIEVDPPGAESFSMQSPSAPTSEGQYLETHAQNLQTDDLLISVIRQLRLDLEPDFVKPGKHASTTSEPGRLSEAENAALLTFRTRLKVVHNPNNHILAASVMAHDPRLAANITNTLAQAFVDRTIKMRRDAISNSRAWLQTQLDEVRAKVEQADRDLADFQRRTGVADIDEGRNSFGDLVTDLNRQTTQIQSERIQLQSYLQKAREGETDSLPQIRDNPVVQKLTQNLEELRTHLSENQVIYGPNHPNTKKLRNQELEIERQLSIQKKEALNQLHLNYDAARAREQMMEAQKKEATKTLGDMAEYNILKKQAQSQSALYNSLLGRIEEAGISAASQSTNIRLVDTARILHEPTRPHRLRGLLLGLFAGVFAGVLLTYVRERLDNPLRTPEDIRSLTGIASVSIIPEFYSKVSGLLPAWTNGRGVIESPQTFLLDRPHSPESEAVRGLEANVVLSYGEETQSVLVTSSIPGEGKTTVAINLALALSHRRRTCLIDADLRRPCIAAACGLDKTIGLGDVLTGSLPLEDALVELESSPGLFVLPGGEGSNERAHLIGGAEMRSIMNWLRSRFDYIVVDTAPILPYAEGRVLSTMTDGIIFVARSGLTPGPAMLRSMELLHEVKSPHIIKVVFNCHTPPRHDQYYYSSISR